MGTPSQELATDPALSWWCFSVESTLGWPSLRPYKLKQVSLVTILDEDDELEELALHANPECASLRLPQRPYGAHYASGRGGLDDRAEMTLLVDRFMKYIHAKQPVLDPSVLYNQIALVEEEGLGWNAATCLLLFACALGTICTPYDHDTLEDYSRPSIDAEQYLRSREYFDAGRKRLGLVMGRTSITGAQCFFLAAGYYVTVFRPLAAWRNLNAASVMCRNVLTKTGDESLGSEDALRGSDGSATNSRRKLFWSCLKTEREIASELGFNIAHLQLIEYERSPSLMPGYEAYEEGESDGLHPSHPTTTSMVEGRGLTAEELEQSWFYYLTDISLRKLEIRIDSFFRAEQAKEQEPSTESRESFYRGILDTLADLDEQIVDHFSNLPACISVETDQQSHSPDDLREYLRLRMIVTRHALSRPALHLVLHAAFDGLSLSLQGQAIQIANKALSIDGYLVTHGLTTHRHPGTWLGIRYCTRAALELFAASKSAIVGLALPLNWEVGMQNLKTALRYWSAESRDALMYLDWLLCLESAM